MHALIQSFETAHEQAYGYRLERDVEIVTARITAFVERPELKFPELPFAECVSQAVDTSDVHGVGRVSHFRRADLRPGPVWHGPALVLDDTATLWLPECWSMQVSGHGHLLLEKTDQSQNR